MRTSSKIKAFTILELLVVVAIIAILAAISIPSFIGKIEQAKASQNLAEINAVTKAVNTYYADKGNYPTLQGKDGSLLQPQPILGSPHNVDFSSLVPEYLATLPHFSYWWVDYQGKIYHTENTLGSVTANVFTPNSEFTYTLHKADGSILPLATTYTLQANEYILPKDADEAVMPVLSGVFKNAKEHPESGIPAEVAGSIKQIVAGSDHTMALMADGSVLAWGNNSYGQLGDNTTVAKKLPVYVKNLAGTGNLTGVKSIAAGAYHTFALLEDGNVLAWGYNNFGQLGDNTIVNKKLPVYVKNTSGTGNLTGVKSIAAGMYHTSSLMEDGSVLSWGRSNFGQLGDNTIVDKKLPVYVKNTSGTGNLTGVNSIAAGQYHTLALMEDGNLLAWGYNDFGQLGDNTVVTKRLPVYVKNGAGTGNLTGVKSMAAGLFSSIALQADGSALAWGYNAQGQLGDNTIVDKKLPVYVKNTSGTGNLTGVKSIAAGLYHNILLLADGSVVSLGYNNYGQIGDNTFVDKKLPVYVKNIAGTGNLTGVKSMTAGAYHTLSLMLDGSVLSFGYNGEGALGDNTLVNKSLPVYVRNSDNTDNLK